MIKKVYICDLCGKELEIKYKDGGRLSTAMLIHLKYERDIDRKEKRKLLICPACIDEIRERANKTKEN